LGASPSVSTEVTQLQAQVRDLSVKLEDQAEARTRQADAFNADAITISVVSALGVLLVTLGGLAAALMGYRFIQTQVKDHLATRVNDAIKIHGREIFEREAGVLHAEYDTKLADLYARGHKLVAPE
jgi:hypothetical protein